MVHLIGTSPKPAVFFLLYQLTFTPPEYTPPTTSSYLYVLSQSWKMEVRCGCCFMVSCLYLAELIIFSLAKRSPADKWQVRKSEQFHSGCLISEDLVARLHLLISDCAGHEGKRREAWFMYSAGCTWMSHSIQGWMHDADRCDAASKTSASARPTL